MYSLSWGSHPISSCPSVRLRWASSPRISVPTDPEQVVDPEAWRGDVRRKGRQDKVHALAGHDFAAVQQLRVVAGRPVAIVGVDALEALLVRDEHHLPADIQAAVDPLCGAAGALIAGSRYPRSALTASPLLASLARVVLTVARPRPVAVAPSPAVIAASVESAPRTLALVAPRAVRADELSFAWATARLRGAAERGARVLAVVDADRCAGLVGRFGADLGAGFRVGSVGAFDAR